MFGNASWCVYRRCDRSGPGVRRWVVHLPTRLPPAMTRTTNWSARSQLNLVGDNDNWGCRRPRREPSPWRIECMGTLIGRGASDRRRVSIWVLFTNAIDRRLTCVYAENALKTKGYASTRRMPRKPTSRHWASSGDASCT